MSQHISSASNIRQLWTTYSEAMEQAVEDVVFGHIYLVQDDDSAAVPSDSSESGPREAKKCVLQETVGVSESHASVIPSFSLREIQTEGSNTINSFVKAWTTGEIVLLSSEDGSLRKRSRLPIPGRGYGDRIRNAIVAPITSHLSHEILGIVIMGLDPRSPYDDEYILWNNLILDLLGKAASLVSLPEEQRRAQKIADDINSSLAQQ